MTKPALTIKEGFFRTLRGYDDDVWVHPTAYVDRSRVQDHRPAYVRLRDELLEGWGDEKRLFTGQIGAGKSTELRQLVADPELQKRYVVVVVDANDRLNLARFVDVRYLLVALAEGLARTLERSEMVATHRGFAAERQAQVREWVRILSSRDPLPDPNQFDGRAFATALATKLTGLSSSLKTDDKLRRELVEQEVRAVRDLVVLLADELARHTGREVLVVVDDLDKIRDRDTLVHLFRDQLDTLQALNLKWVMTMPYGVRFDPGYQVPIQLVTTLPNVKIVRRDAPTALLPAARAFFGDLLASVAHAGLVDPVVVERTALRSAGIPREFLRLMHKAFGVAHYAGATIVAGAHLDAAEIELRNELQPLHADSTVTLRLELVRARPDKLDPAQQGLMAIPLVVEYTNDVQWYDVHPLLVDEYDRRLVHRAKRLGVDPADRDALVEDLLSRLD